MKLLDTNIVVYAIGRPHRYKNACAQLLRDIAAGASDFNIDAELLQEILYLYAARGERQIGLSTCDDLLAIFPTPYPIAREEIVLARELMERHPQLSPRDAIHAGVVQANDLDGIVSADTVFDLIDNLKRIDPLSLQLGKEDG